MGISYIDLNNDGLLYLNNLSWLRTHGYKNEKMTRRATGNEGSYKKISQYSKENVAPADNLFISVETIYNSSDVIIGYNYEIFGL